MKRLATLVLGAALAASAVTTPARAMQLPPEVSYRISYYSDYSMQTLIGQYQINCDSSDAGWGYISEWNFAEYGDC